MTDVKPTSSQVLAEKRRKVFLKVLARTGKVVVAARAIGLSTTTSLYEAKNRDEDFSNAWDAAILASADLLEEAAWDRAVDGVEEPILFKGEVVATKVNYSDTLLLAMLASRKKEYQKRTALDVNADVNVRVGIAVIPMTASDPAAWETHAKLVHDGQRQLPAFEEPIAEAEFVEIDPKTGVEKEKAKPVQRQVTLERGG